MDPTNPSPYSFVYHFSKDPATHESLIHRAMNENPESSEIEILKHLSLAIEATSIGQFGYEIQTWCGTTYPENLNKMLYKTFALIGVFFIVFSFQLKVKNRDHIEDRAPYIESLQPPLTLPNFFEMQN